MKRFYKSLISVILILWCSMGTAALAFEAGRGQTATSASQVFEEWLDAFNSADAAKLSSLYARYHIDLPVGRDLALRERSGGFTVMRREVTEPLRAVAFLREKASDTVVRVELTLSPGDPPAITNLGLRRVPGLPDDAGPAPAPAAAKPDTLDAIPARIDALAAQDRFSGVVLLAHGKDVVFEKAAGLADRTGGTPVTMDSRFRIGSMNKMFTAVAILQLVEAGRMDLDAPVGQYLPAYPNRQLAGTVTVRHLLSHCGGTGDIFGADFDAHRLDLKTSADYIALYGTRAPEFTPGSRFAYSNYGYVLLGAVIEHVTGQSYYDYLDAHIFRPAGMTATGSLPETEIAASLTIGYTPGTDGLSPNTSYLPWRGTAAGGGYSTAKDLLAFARALQSGILIKPDSLAQATSSQIDNDRGGYGFGFHPIGDGRERYYGHGGGSPGMNGELRIYPGSDDIIVVLSNFDPPAATDIVEAVLDAKHL